jgi:uncharacterized protein
VTATLAAIWRHPIKSHGREMLASVVLTAGQTLPWDRHWAVAHDAARLGDPGEWAPCVNFSRGAKTASLMAIEASFSEASGQVTLRHPDRPVLTFDPDGDATKFLDWVRPLCPTDRARPDRMVSAGTRGMTDTDYPSLSILNLASNADLSARMGADLSPLRWRGNLWVEGAEAWAEERWAGRRVSIGDAMLEVIEPIVRCKATTANPDTGRIDADTLGGLSAARGQQTFGVYARVVSGGTVRAGDVVELA